MLAFALVVAAHVLVLAALGAGAGHALLATAPSSVALSVAPLPPLPQPQRPRARAGGSPATAPRRARPSAPHPAPSRAPPARLRPPAPTPVLPLPAPSLAAPLGPILSSPVAGAGASAGTGGDGVGAGSGPGGPGGAGLLDPQWVREPSDDEVADHYPLPAWRAGRGGSVVLRCRERGDGRVDRCRVLSETPPGEGFGGAALALSRVFRFRPFRVDGRPAETALTVPYDFSVGDGY